MTETPKIELRISYGMMRQIENGVRSAATSTKEVKEQLHRGLENRDISNWEEALREVNEVYDDLMELVWLFDDL